MISPLAHIDPEAKLGKDVKIHPFVFISKNVEIGDNCEIYPFVSILNGSRIGKRCKIYNGAIIGAEPQDLRWKGELGTCIIGDDCKIREHTIINRGISPEGGTYVGEQTFIMAESHITHDCHIAGHAVIGGGVTLSVGSKVGANSILSSGSMLQAGCEVGEWVLIKGGCRINGNVPPYVIMAHNPVSYYGVNAYILRHCKHSEESIDEIAKAYRHVYQCGTSTFNALKRIEADIKPSPERDAIVKFIRDHDLKIVAVPSHDDVID